MKISKFDQMVELIKAAHKTPECQNGLAFLIGLGNFDMHEEAELNRMLNEKFARV